MPETVLSGEQVADRINHGYWFYNPTDLNSIVTDAAFNDGILSFVWAGGSECQQNTYRFVTATDDGDGRITIIAKVSFFRLDSGGATSGTKELPVIKLYDHRHVPGFPTDGVTTR